MEGRLVSGQIVAREDDSVTVDLDEITAEQKRFWLGLFLAVSSTIFIGSSFVIKKVALIHLVQSGGIRAGSGGFGYLKNWLWWAGLITMGVGEACNFSAYALVAASLVTPLGALSVLVSALLAAHFLKESLNLLGKIGCTLCILGSTVIVIHAPIEGDVDNLEQLGSMLTEIEFVIYMLFVLISSFILIAFLAPKFGNRNVLIYVLICSLVGSLSVMACKGLGLAIRETLSGEGNRLKGGLFWFFLFSVILSVTIQMNYLNKALDVFETTLVTPIYYVFFTTFVLIASNILFKEWRSMFYQDILGSLCGFLVLIIAIFLLNAFSDFDITFDSLRKQWMREKSQGRTSLIPNVSKVKYVFENDNFDSSRDALIPVDVKVSSTFPSAGIKTSSSMTKIGKTDPTPSLSHKKLTKTRKTKKRTTSQSQIHRVNSNYSSTESAASELEV